MLQQVQGFLEMIAGYVWGWPMLILLVGTGLFMTVWLRGLQFYTVFPALWDAFGPQGGKRHGKGTISNRAALLTALAATVGTGNIAGVATAIGLGGPGALFWMWISGLLGMAVKYAETLLGVYYRQQRDDGQYHGGPMYYLTDGAGVPWLGAAYAGGLAFAALCVGGMIQNNSIADALSSSFAWSPTAIGAVVALMAALVMFGGLKRIAHTANVLVPFMIVVYLAAGSLILLTNMAYLPEVFGMIFSSAFGGEAMAGGAAGSAVMLAMRFGLARGVFSNESGFGSAAVVASTAQTRHPGEQALISMTQTFIDTLVVCTFTGLVILVTGALGSGEAVSEGASLTTLAFSYGLGNVMLGGITLGGAVVAVCLVLFAFTTILGWGYYGQQGAVYLFGPRAAQPYLVVFLLMTLAGAMVLDVADSVREGVRLVWTIADVATVLIIVPNLYGLWRLSPLVRRLTRDYMGRVRYGRKPLFPSFYEEEMAAAMAKPKAKPKPKGKARRR